VLPTALQVQEERLARISTARLNRILMGAQEMHPPPSRAGRQLKIFYGTQVRNDPPTIVIFVNDPQLMHFSYLRFLENRIREAYPFTGTPIKLVVKGRAEK
jgi:GTP-binding protein